VIDPDPDAKDDFGELVSRFVETRVGGPEHDEDVDFWCEAIYAGLFVASFRLLPYWCREPLSDDLAEERIGTLIADVECHAKPWIDSRLSDWARNKSGLSIQFDSANFISARISTYTNVALEAVEARGYNTRTAATHAIAACLSQLEAHRRLRQIIEDAEMKRRNWLTRIFRPIRRKFPNNARSQGETTQAVLRVVNMSEEFWDELDQTIRDIS
jgi:hypothetical protein